VVGLYTGGAYIRGGGLIVGGLRYRGEHLMLHIEAGVQTLSYTDIGVKNLCYVKGQGYKPYLTLI
jgi:hypothetical protein